MQVWLWRNNTKQALDCDHSTLHLVGCILNLTYIIIQYHLAHSCRYSSNDNWETECRPEHLSVIVGNMTKLAGQEYRVVLAVRYPGYYRHSFQGQYNDIALLKVDRDITMQPYNVAPICLPQYNYHNTEEEYGLVAGWGAVASDTNVPIPQHLQIGWIKIQKSYQDHLGFWTSKIIVQKTPAVNGTAPCKVMLSETLISKIRYIDIPIVSFEK